MAAKDPNKILRDLALDQYAAMLKTAGCTDEEIATARAEAEETDSEKPIRDLYMSKLSGFIGAFK